MIEPEQPSIEIDDLTAVIRESIAAQKHENGFVSAPATEAPVQSAFPELKLQPDFQPRSNNRYHINDLLRYHDRAFVENAYRAILKRLEAQGYDPGRFVKVPQLRSQMPAKKN